MTVPKHLTDKETGEPLPLRRYLESKYFTSQAYEDAGIAITDLSSEDILEAVREFWELLQGERTPDDCNAQLQQRFWDMFLSHPSYLDGHDWKHPGSVVGSHWLASQKDTFFE